MPLLAVSWVKHCIDEEDIRPIIERIHNALNGMSFDESTPTVPVATPQPPPRLPDPDPEILSEAKQGDLFGETPTE